MNENSTDAADRNDSLGEIVRLFEQRGATMYAGEPVTQLQHALQSAWLAEQAGESSATIAAALLHDIGHLSHDLGEDCAEGGIDDRHEAIGADWLAEHFGFGPAVTEPIRLHVPAKRYLCAVDPVYLDRLSDASRLSLELQGGPFTTEEVAVFRDNDYWESALRLRGWDDQAKEVGLRTPELNHFLPFVAVELELKTP